MVRTKKTVVETAAAAVARRGAFEPRMAKTTAKIAHVIGREILDSRGNPTVEADVILASNQRGRAAVPSGQASTGEHEAIELRDGDKSRYLGKGTRKAAENINGPIAKAVTGMNPRDQKALDRKMLMRMSRSNKSQIGAIIRRLHGRCDAKPKSASSSSSFLLFSFLLSSSSVLDQAQRRRARGQFCRCAGIYGHAHWRAEFSRSATVGRRGVSPFKGRAEEERLFDCRW